jgi:dihydrofolate synthase / folylpolyglutamate synthase
VTPYEQLLARLLPARRFGIVLGLERMHAIFERLGHPERQLGTVIHVGGTNGKGSTVAMIAHLLRGDTVRVATYTSPHLSCLRERIQFGVGPQAWELISEGAIVRAADRVRVAGGDELTFFEQLTAIACVAIAERGVDYTVLEVGLGGRLDATNAIDAQVAVVTGVAMDHAPILGDTLDEIAREKAGIFKPGQRVVIGASGEPAAVPVLIEVAERVGAAITVVGDAELAALQPNWRLGAVQLPNAAAAIAAVQSLGLSADAALNLEWTDLPPGRFELVETDDHDILLDGAHNPHAAAALAGELRTRLLKPILIVAVSSDKDVQGIVAALAPAATHVIATRYQQERSLSADDLAAAFRATGASVETAPDLATALARARDLDAPFNRDYEWTATHPLQTILITGSLFLVGEARVALLGAPADPYVVTDPAPKP